VGDLASRLARRYWDDQYVAHFSPTHNDHPCLTPDEAQRLLDFLRGADIGSVLFVPLGAGAECLGFLVLSRISDDPAWTNIEHDAALDIGHDLGRAVANARQLEKERGLVTALREIDDYRAELMNTVAHELRSPLTAVMGNLEMAEFEDQLSEPGRRSVEAALRGARRIEAVIDDLLTVARFSDPHVIFDPVHVDLRDVVRDVAEECGHSAAARSIVLTADLPDEPVHVPGRAEELHRALANLTGNAIKYSEDGSLVHVRLQQREHDVLLSVADHGLGISEDDQANLFREFQRSSNPEALRRPGTGLGLVIVQRIVRRHGGDIGLESQLGRGTTVTLTLPSTLDG
jgi:signal transduction histidine kinase